MLCCWRLILTHHLCPNPRGTPLYQGSDLSRCVSVTCCESLKQLQHTDPFAIDFLGLWWWSRLPGLWFTVDLILLCTRRMNCTIELVFPSMPWEQLWQKVLQLMACIEATTVVMSVVSAIQAMNFPLLSAKAALELLQCLRFQTPSFHCACRKTCPCLMTFLGDFLWVQRCRLFGVKMVNGMHFHPWRVFDWCFSSVQVFQNTV
jgi:hypothetical protein